MKCRKAELQFLKSLKIHTLKIRQKKLFKRTVYFTIKRNNCLFFRFFRLIVNTCPLVRLWPSHRSRKEKEKEKEKETEKEKEKKKQKQVCII
jgi:hypothetical protein